MPPGSLSATDTNTGADREASAVCASVTDLSVTLRRRGAPVHALRGVDLTIQRGEIVGLVGESGSGKTMLGLTLLGLLPDEAAPHATGTVEVEGVDMLAGSSESQRRLRRDHLGAVFQDPMTSLDPTMRVGPQLREVVSTDRAAIDLLHAVGVPEAERRMRSFPHELSGGLRQRVMIATAIAGQPRLVVADEPTTALDVTVQAQILALLGDLCRETGAALLFVTHDLGVAAALAERIVVLYGGRVMEDGRAEDVLAAPRHPYSAGLVRSRLDLGAERGRKLATLPGEPPNPEQPEPGCPFAPRCDFAQERCTEQIPAAAALAGRRVACIRADEVDVLASGVASTFITAAAREVDAHGPAVARLTDVHFDVPARGRRLRRELLHVLRGVDLHVQRGESVALVGESGCGKTTLLRMVSGTVTPTGGQLSIAGAVQMVFQDAGASLTPWMTVGEMIEDRLRAETDDGRRRRERIAEVLGLVGLPGEAARARPRELSGGQRQRVSIARAVAVPPPLLLCDEPTSALDVSVAASILNLLSGLRTQLDMAMLFVTHDLGVARLVADRIAVMYAGRIVEEGRAEEIIAAPAHPYTRALVAAVTDPPAAAKLTRGEPPPLTAPPSGCAFRTRCPLVVPVCAEGLPPRLTPPEHPDQLVECVHGGRR